MERILCREIMMHNVSSDVKESIDVTEYIDLSKIKEAKSNTVIGKCYLCHKKITIGCKSTLGVKGINGKAEIYHEECLQRKFDYEEKLARRTLVMMLGLSGAACHVYDRR